MSEMPILVTCPSPHIALVTINRPAASNAINGATARALEAAVERIEQDDDIWAAILTGSGDRAFCGGADLKAIAAGERLELHTDRGGFAGFVEAPRDKLWIAAVEGAAFAGGLEIALACDIIVASDTARFGLPEVARGLVAAAGGLYRLPRRISRGAALEMIATGRPVDAARAEAISLIDHRVPAGEAVAKAIELATAVCANAPIAVRESLKVARRALDEDAASLRELSMAAAMRNSQTEDFAEGPRAFIEKRQPAWQGR